MDLLKTLKQFKTIEPDRGFTERSRGLILGVRTGSKISLWDIVIRNVESGASLALAGLLIFTILGGLSAWNQAFSPAPFEALNPTSLRAEAQAVDIQIELANLNYEAAPTRAGGESTAIFSPTIKQSAQDGATVSEKQSLSLSEALELLSE